MDAALPHIIRDLDPEGRKELRDFLKYLLEGRFFR